MEYPVWQTTSMELHRCNSYITNPEKLKEFFKGLCEKIKMTPFGKPIIIRFGKGELEGYTAVQFIETSSINFHGEETGMRAFIDITSCKEFNGKKAGDYCKSFFEADKIRYRTFPRV